ncbi:hypothetical protein [Nostoc sp.]|uniref:hypothetical protein n=1 Tax=Nostoc sp. TaxID=1180 RepID=UPI002FF6D27F
MALLKLQELFGASVVETLATVTIQKADLLGLTALPVNTADSLLAAIINTVNQRYEGELTDQNGAFVVDEKSIPITYDNHLYYTTTWVQFWGFLFPPEKVNFCFLISEISPYAD